MIAIRIKDSANKFIVHTYLLVILDTVLSNSFKRRSDLLHLSNAVTFFYRKIICLARHSLRSIKWPAAWVCLVFFGFPDLSCSEETDFQYFTASGQSTGIWQKHSGFSAPYSGPSSLSSDPEIGYTISATLFLGARPWKGTEFFLDPEIASGVPFSGLRGFAGVPNGESQKAGSVEPINYVARAFLRQTFGFGGGEVEQAPGFNIFGGTVDRRRLVVTAGIYAITDIFDQNAYAHDPRTQFMNWAFMDYGAWDMPADARGYTRGVAVEYYDDNWAFRAGRNLLPAESNGLALNSNITQSYSDNFEIERAHEIMGQPGKLRALLFRNRASFGNFNDAVAYGQAAGIAPVFDNSRSDQVKYGFGVSLEQAITKDIGLFGRYSWNNGQTEAYSFTDMNNSITAGLSIKGTSWTRPDDVVGIAVASNGISDANINFLKAGGSDYFCGDGDLNYGRENIGEIYYSVKVTDFLWATLDYQRINNPCYNKDRGPTNVYSVRAHLEF